MLKPISNLCFGFKGFRFRIVAILNAGFSGSNQSFFPMICFLKILNFWKYENLVGDPLRFLYIMYARNSLYIYIGLFSAAVGSNFA